MNKSHFDTLALPEIRNPSPEEPLLRPLVAAQAHLHLSKLMQSDD